MENLLKIMDERFVYCSHEITENSIVIQSIVNSSQAKCPNCHTISSSKNGTYMHRFQDLPIQGLTVFIHLSIQLFLCKNEQCSVRTFSERYSFVAPHAQKSKRLLQEIEKMSLTQSSLDAVRHLKDLGIETKKSSICNYLKKSQL